MTKSSSAFLDYRSPYVWHSRAVNFNRQLIKKLNQVQKCNSKQVVAQSGANKKNLARIEAGHRKNAPATASFFHRLLEPLSSESTSTSSSLAPSLSSLSSCESCSEGKEVTAAATTTTTFASSLYPKYQSNVGNNKMARNYLEHYNNNNNTSRTTTTGYQFGHHSSTPFSPPGGRCPVHGTGQHQPYKQHLNLDGSAAHPWYSSSGDLQEYPAHLHSHHPAYFSTLPYSYHMAYGQADKQQQQHQQYLGHHYPPHYYTSQMYPHLPSSYHHLHNYHHHYHPHHLRSPMGQYLSPSALYTSKHHLPYSSHQQQPRRSSNRPFEFTSTATSHSNIRLSGLPSLDHLHSQQNQQQQQTSSSRCKGHLIVLATILSVIIIGTLLGFALAIIS